MTKNNFRKINSIWFKEIPSNWKFLKLKHAVDFFNGFAFKSEDFVDQGTSIVRIGDISSSIDVEGCRKVDILKYPNTLQSRIMSGDILIAMTGATIGKNSQYLQSDILYANQRVGILRARHNMTQMFLRYVINTYELNEYIRLICSGSAQENISSSEINDFEIPIPPVEEQTKIASFLDKKTAQIDAIIDKKQNLLNLLEEKKKAVINEAVTKGLNANAPMKDSGIEWIGEIPEEYDIKSLKYLAKVNPSTAITDDTVTFLPMEKVKEDWSFEKGSFGKFTDFSVGLTKFQKNDILVAKITPCFENGKGVLLEELETNFGVGSTEFHIIRSGDIELAKYISYVIRSSSFMQVGEANMTGSAGQKRVPTDFLNNYPICLPASRLEMVKTTDYLDKFIDQLSIIKLKVNFQLEKLKEYRQSLISEAVTGKIDVSNYN